MQIRGNVLLCHANTTDIHVMIWQVLHTTAVSAFGNAHAGWQPLQLIKVATAAEIARPASVAVAVGQSCRCTCSLGLRSTTCSTLVPSVGARPSNLHTKFSGGLVEALPVDFAVAPGRPGCGRLLQRLCFWAGNKVNLPAMEPVLASLLERNIAYGPSGQK